jgi:hypothetical protein
MSEDNFNYVKRNRTSTQTREYNQYREMQTNNGNYNRNYNRVIVRTTQTRRKSSRTLLLKEVGDKEFKYEGLQQVEKSPQGNLFLVFDTLENSRKAFKDLRVNKVNCKYSYYKLFFKSTNLEVDKLYDDLKLSFINLLRDNVNGSNVLYFKYYRKDGKFTGSGDFVVDRKVDCDALVKSRILKLGELEYTFYRYRTQRRLSEESNVLRNGSEGNNSEEETQ